MGGGGGDEEREVRELYLECSADALVAFHNEAGFQPKDLYAMCQVRRRSHRRHTHAIHAHAATCACAYLGACATGGRVE